MDEDGNPVVTEEIVSDIDDDLALDGEEYHEALLGYREARDLLKEARVAPGFYPVVVRIRSDKLTGRGKGDSSSVKNFSGKTGRGKGGRVFKSSGRSLDSRGRGKKGYAECAQELATVLRIHRSVSSVVRLITGHVIVRSWMTGLPIRRSIVRGLAIFLTMSVLKSVQIILDVDCGATTPFWEC